MNLPSFNKFLDTLTQDEVKKIMDSAQDVHDKAAKIGPGGDVPTVSWTITLELLARYHIWLQSSSQDSE